MLQEIMQCIYKFVDPRTLVQQMTYRFLTSSFSLGFKHFKSLRIPNMRVCVCVCVSCPVVSDSLQLHGL